MPKISHTGLSFSMNNERKMHHHARAALVREWRQAVQRTAPRWRAVGPVGIEVFSWCRADADRGAYYPAAKAMIDGLNDVWEDVYGRKVRTYEGWWPDDDGEWVYWERHWAPVRDMSLPKGCIRVELDVSVL